MSNKDKVIDEFYSILLPKDCGRYSKSAKSNYERAVSRMDHTLRSLNRKLNNEEYTKYQPEVDDKVIGYYEAIIGSFKSSLRNFIKTGNWSYISPSTSQETKDKFNTFMEDDNKYGSYFDGRPETVNEDFEKVVKTLKKNNFSSSNLEDVKKAEEEAKKPKMPETISFVKTEDYDPQRMINYKTNSRGEEMAKSSYLQKRQRQFYFAKKYEEKYPFINNYLNTIFNAFDNAWFAYVGGQTPILDFRDVDDIYRDQVEDHSIIKQFNDKVCGAPMYVGGTSTINDCKECLNKMLNNRQKVIKTITMEKEDTYSLWEKSVDAILNDEGKPSLNAFLDNWVKDIVAYFTNKENIKRWKNVDKNLTKEISDYDNKMNEISIKWSQEHSGNKSLTWRDARYGYKNLPEYIELENKKETANRIKASNNKDLSIANMGEKKILKMFQEQAAAVKKSFITSVCEKAGILKSGVFYWSEQNTGHLNGTVVGADDSKWKITSFFAGGHSVQRLHCRTKITKLVR